MISSQKKKWCSKSIGTFSKNNYNNPYTSTTLSPKIKVTEQIYLINKSNKLRPFYSWIQGHQDNNKEKEELPLLAQLNIEADKIAGDFQHTNGHYRPQTTMLSSRPATLSIQNISITSKYQYHIQHAYNRPVFIQKLEDKHN